MSTSKASRTKHTRTKCKKDILVLDNSYERSVNIQSNNDYLAIENGCEYDDIKKMMKAVSLESIISGISSGSSASEERQNSLRSVTSFSCSSAKSLHSTINPKIQNHSNNPKRRKTRRTVSFPVTETQRKTRRCKSQSSLQNGESARTTSGKSSISSSKSFNEIRPNSTNSKSLCDERSRGSIIPTTDNKKVQFDAALEKSKTYLHGQGKTFSKANQYLTPARPGLQKLQISYTQTNTENNHRKIFCDLVKNAHRKNIIVHETVRSLERRLLSRRNDPARSTTYYEQKGIVDPIRKKKKARTVADKQKERNDRIKQTSEELRIGYVPTEQTMKVLGPEDIEKLRSCSYLRLGSDL